MAKPDAIDAAVGAYREVFAHANDLVRVAALPALVAGAIAVAGAYVVGLIGGFLGGLAGLLFAAAAGAFAYCINIAWFRAVHSGFARVGQVLPLAPSVNELRFLTWAVGVGILPPAIIGLFLGDGTVAWFIRIAIGIAVLIIAVRLSFFFEELALDKVTTPGTSFNATRFDFTGILGGVILAIIPVLIVLLILGMIFNPLIGSIGIIATAIFQLVAAAMGAVTSALMVSVVNAYYRAA